MTIPLQEAEIALQRKEQRLSEHKKRHTEKQELVQAVQDLQKERLHMSTSINSVPEGEQKPTLVAWILYDATTDKKYIKKNPTDGSLAIFDSEEAAKKAKRLYPGTEYKRCEYYSAPQPTPDVAGLVEIAQGIVDLHAKRKVVLTVHVEALEDALAAYRKGGEK